MQNKEYLPIWLFDVPLDIVYNAVGKLRENVRHAVNLGIVRIIVGPIAYNICIEIKRPYFRALPVPYIDGESYVL